MMMFWRGSLVSLVFSRLLHLPVFPRCHPHTLPLSGQGWNGVPKTPWFWAALRNGKGCGSLLGYWAKGWGSGLHGYKREEVEYVLHSVFTHSKFITARSFEILSYFCNAVAIRIFSIYVSLAGCIYYFLKKSTSCAGTRLFVTLVPQAHTNTHPHPHTHRIVGGRGETLWSAQHSLQFFWCTLTDLYSQEREKERWKWRM